MGWKDSEYEMTAFRYQDEKDGPRPLEIISKKTSVYLKGRMIRIEEIQFDEIKNRR